MLHESAARSANLFALFSLLLCCVFCIDASTADERHACSTMVVSDNVNTSSGKIFYRESCPKNGTAKADVLLLHGMRFSSETWLNLGTLDRLSAWDFRAIAIDLPGYGESRDVSLKGSEANLLKEICQELSITKPAIISPSMSGGYSLPYLTERSNEIGAYIPVAPVSTEKYKEHYPAIKVPTLIVYGELDFMPDNLLAKTYFQSDRDTGLGKTSLDNLSKIPGHKVMKMDDAGHACYLDHPDVWHDGLKEFLQENFP